MCTSPHSQWVQQDQIACHQGAGKKMAKERLSNVSDNMRSAPENLSLNVIAKQSSPKADLREKYFLTLFPSTVQAVGGTCRVAIRSLQGEGHAASCSRAPSQKVWN